MVNYFFPPLGGIAAVRALKFATYLPEFGWEPVVVAPNSGTGPQDPGLASSGIRIERTGNLRVGGMLQGAFGAAQGGAATEPGRLPARVRGALRRWAHTWIYRPDAQVGWFPFAVAASRRALRRESFDAILSSAFPITAHLVARRLHHETGLPWVAEFRDLWTDWGRPQSRRTADEATERQILEEATAIVTVSPTYAAVFRARGAKRAWVVTNGFDPADYPEPPGPCGEFVVYLGTYYPEKQDLRTPLRAIGRLVKNGEAPGLRVRFVGDWPSPLNDCLLDSGLADAECTGFIGHREAVRQISSARLLLLAGPTSADTPVMRGNVAGKTFQYLGSGRPILMVGAPESDVAKMLRGLPGVGIVEPGDVDGATRAALQLLREAPPARAAALTPFTHRALAADLARILTETAS